MVLITLLASNAYAEVNKPYKVCPEVVTAKDTPCKVATPTAAIAHRIEVTNDKEKRLQQLEEENKLLRKLVEELTNDKSSK